MSTVHDPLVSRTYILKRLNITASDLNAMLHARVTPFPKPVLTHPNARWSLNEINRHLTHVKHITRLPTSDKHYIVMFEYPSTWGHIRDEALAARIKTIPELMAYVNQRRLAELELWANDIATMGEENAGIDPGAFNEDVLVDISTVPRHHPALVDLVRSLPKELRHGLRLCRIPYSSYNFHQQEDGREVYASFVAHFDTTVIPVPGDDTELQIKMIPAPAIAQVLSRHCADPSNPALVKLIEDLNALLDK